MTTSEDNITALVKDTNQLMALASAQPSAAINTLAGHTTDLAALAPAAAAIKTNAENIAAIQGVEGYADNAEAARDAAQTAAQQVVTNSGVPPILANAIRAEYKIAGRMPSVVIDPVKGVYFAPSGVKPFEGLVDHTRDGTAAFTDHNGLIQTSTSDTPRLEHHVLDDGIWKPVGLRVDAQSTNLINDSEDFTPNHWQKHNCTIAASVEKAPDGTYTATEMTFGAANVRLSHPYQITESGPLTLSAFLKKGTGSWARLLINSYSEKGGSVWFNLDSGTIGTSSPDVDAAHMENVGNGWYRCSATMVVDHTIDPAGALDVWAANADYTSAVTDGEMIHVWGFQAEMSGTPTSYIKTTGSPVTRHPDRLIIPAANLPSTSGEYTFLLEGYIDWPDADQSLKYLTFWDQALGPRYAYLIIRGEGAYKSRFEAVHYDGNIMSGASSPYETFSPGMKVEIKAAVSFSGAGTKMAVNGALFGPGVGPDSILPLTDGKLVLVDGIPFSLTKFRVFDSALSNAALTGATAL